MPLPMYVKFLVIITVVIAFTTTIAGATSTVAGQNQIINLTELLTPDTNNDTTTTTTATIPANITAANNTSIYLMNMTADYEIAAANGTKLQLIEDVQVGNITSHRPNTEMFLTLTL